MRRPEIIWTIVAAGLHCALPVMAYVAPQPDLVPIVESGEQMIIDVETPERPEREPLREEPASAVPAPNEGPVLPSTEEMPRTFVPGPSVTAEPTAPAPTTSASAQPTPDLGPVITSNQPATGAPGEYSGPPPSAPIAGGGAITLPGIGAGTLWLPQGMGLEGPRPAPAPTVAPARTVDPHIATKVLTDAVKEKDKGLGLDLPGAGTLGTAIKQAVQAATLPSGSATYELRLSPAGKVVSARLVSSSGGSSGEWDAAGKAALGRVLQMGSAYAKGAIVRVQITKTTTLPSGSTSGIQQKGAGATFDVSDIGAHQQTVVRSSVSVSPVQ